MWHQSLYVLKPSNQNNETVSKRIKHYIYKKKNVETIFGKQSCKSLWRKTKPIIVSGHESLLISSMISCNACRFLSNYKYIF